MIYDEFSLTFKKIEKYLEGPKNIKYSVKISNTHLTILMNLI